VSKPALTTRDVRSAPRAARRGDGATTPPLGQRSDGTMRRSLARRSDAGQATVEVVGMLPLVAVVAFAALQALAAGLAAELADHAAEAGAVAILEGTDPHDAAKKAIPGWSGAHIDVAVHGKTVRVRVRPPAVLPSVGDLLASTAEAKAAR
jgi:hypothetical protein